MVRRFFAALLLVGGLLVSGAAPASADVGLVPPTLVKATVTVYPPVVPQPGYPPICTNQWIQCGYVAVTATFTDLDALLTEPPTQGAPRYNLQGTARVVRVYGCADAQGKRLHRYDRRVVEDATLNTRNSLGFTIPVGAETVDASTYVFLRDAQPRSCPAGTQAMTYQITADRIRLDLGDYSGVVRHYTYRVGGSTTWRGAVPTLPVS